MSTMWEHIWPTCAGYVSRPLWQVLHQRAPRPSYKAAHLHLDIPCWISPASFDLMQDQDGPIQNTMSPGPHRTPRRLTLHATRLTFLPLDGRTPIIALSEVLPFQAVVSKSRTNHTECFSPPRSVLMGHAPDLAIGIRISLFDPFAGLFWPYLHGFETPGLKVPLRYTKSYDCVPQSPSYDRRSSIP
ncbi:hypothetical protein LX36DRAFT_417270 [Colletotrichum falcatum]|nr:hypothetical protein LX36DRAFT_417270 [Colletotrichum falcatum]